MLRTLQLYACCLLASHQVDSPSFRSGHAVSARAICMRGVLHLNMRTHEGESFRAMTQIERTDESMHSSGGSNVDLMKGWMDFGFSI